MNGAARRRLILCFDGTWNTVEDHTNVSRLHAALPDEYCGCIEQSKFYDTGVGTMPGSRFVGGAIGLGLDDNVRQGYCWLIEKYASAAGEPPRVVEEDGEEFVAGDEIFIFGFSRGAYTARSLAGLINRCGLLRRDAFAARGEKIRTSARLVNEAWDLYRQKPPADKEARLQEPWLGFRRRYAWPVKVKFIGVWDTVGALGIPSLFDRQSKVHGFHDTALGRTVENAYHALAIDEHRRNFAATLWTKAHPRADARIEQRWFPGAHGNVGGGYEDDQLPDAPLRWMCEKAVACGLEFSEAFQASLAAARACRPAVPPDFALQGNEHLSPVRDSFRDFMGGVYRLLKFGKRWYRPMMIRGQAVHETIDETAQLKWAQDPTYRPPNLASAGRTDATEILNRLKPAEDVP